MGGGGGGGGGGGSGGGGGGGGVGRGDDGAARNIEVVNAKGSRCAYTSGADTYTDGEDADSCGA